jgi:hypothetical protein
MNNDFDFSWDNLSKNLEANLTNNNNKKWEADKRFWKLAKNEDGTGVAIIRLMPYSLKASPFIKMFHYGLKKVVPGTAKPMWLIANSAETIGAPCPIKEHYMKLTAEGTTEASAEAKLFKRQTKFITNIMVIKDPSNPDNEGKVFLWEFGTKMKDRIEAWLKPTKEDIDLGEEPKELYNPMNGFSIKLKITQKPGEIPSYDSTSLQDKPTSIFTDRDEAIKFIEEKTHKLTEFQQPEYFDSYEVLQGRLNKFIGGIVTPSKVSNTTPDVKDNFDEPTKETKKVESVDDSEDWLNDL